MVSNFALLVLYSWPLVVYFLFQKLQFREALCWSIISGHLLLPNIIGFDLPLLPAYEKRLVVNLSAGVVCIIVAMAALRIRKQAERRGTEIRSFEKPDPGLAVPFKVQRGQVLFWTLVVILFGATFITTMNNGEPRIVGTRFLRGLRTYDYLSINMGLLVIVAPFLLGRRFLASPESHVILLKILVIACLAYSLLVLWEVRMSPQLNKQIYGFGPHRWSQHVRGGAYRPLVFQSHGLRLAILFTMSSLAAMALWREELKSNNGVKWLVASLYLLCVLVLCNSLGALLILIMLLPLVFFLGISVQLLMAAIVAGIILVYPMLRGSGYVPTDSIYSSMARIDTKRADSLQYRFDNEEELLDHANKKPIAGWGTWGRNRVFNEKGADIAATDGYWVIVVGVYGWMGYIAQFGLLGISTILLAARRHSYQVTAATAGLAMINAASLIDLIPNSTMSSITWLIAGALMGRYQTAVKLEKETNLRKAAENISRARGRMPEGTSPVATDTPEPTEKPVRARGGGIRADRPLHQRRPREG